VCFNTCPDLHDHNSIVVFPVLKELIAVEKVKLDDADERKLKVI